MVTPSLKSKVPARPPGVVSASSTTTFLPARASDRAEVRPVKPAPTITASNFWVIGIVCLFWGGGGGGGDGVVDLGVERDAAVQRELQHHHHRQRDQLGDAGIDVAVAHQRPQQR